MNWAIIASLLETCKLNDVNPHTWLTDTLTRLVNRWPASRIDDLMPWNYTKAGSPACQRVTSVALTPQEPSDAR